MTDPTNRSAVRSRSRPSDWDRADQVASWLIDEHGRRDDTVRLIAALGVSGLLLLVVVVTALVLPGAAAQHAERRTVMLVVMGLGIAGAVGWLIWAIVTGRLIFRGQGIVSALSRRDRKDVWRQVRGREPVDERHPTVAIATAVQTRTYVVGIAPVFAGLAVSFGGQFLLRDSWVPWLSLIDLVLYAALVTVLLVQYRIASRFLATRS